MTLITDIKNQFSGTIIRPDDAQYDNARKTYMRVGSPAVIAIPQTTDDIRHCIAIARKNTAILSVKSGGHGGMGQGTNDGGIMLDMQHFSQVEVLDAAKGMVRVGAGARWGNVANMLEEHGLVVSAGDTKSVGVGGLTVGGGIGIMVRKYGLAIDQLIGAEVITASGDVLYTSNSENADLFWAIRGGSGNFGIVTHFDFAAHPLKNVSFGTVMYELNDLKKLLTGWRDAMRSSSNDLTTTLVVMPGFGGNPPFAQLLFCFANDDESAGKEALEPFLAIASVRQQQVKLMPYAEALQEAHPPAGLVPAVKDGLIETLDDTVVNTLATEYADAQNKMMFLRSLGGKVSEIALNETSYTHRNCEALLVCAAFLPEGASDSQKHSAIEFFDKKIAPLTSGAYPNFFTLYNQEDFARMYPADTLERLRDIKTTYDPTNLFSQNYNILPR
jgi:FAD/FMN-containing dehydrogenase